MNSIQIPYDWKPRPHQRDLYNTFGHGKPYKRAVAVWHRRAGKDSTGLNLTARDMFKRVGTYWHMFPEQAQARKAIWNGIDREGRRIINQFLPPEIRTRTASQEMLIELKNGSIWQMAGSDNYDSLVGSNPCGVVFSEYSIANPAAWDYIRPILVENDGWALFIYTPRGRNHGYELFQMALGNDDWLAERLTIEDTGILSEEDMQAERDSGMSENKIRQEYYCDFEAEGDEQFIPSESVANARKRPQQSHMQDAMVLGVDVARFGDDKSVIYFRRGLDGRSIAPEVYEKIDTMQFAARVADAAHRHKADAIFVDEGGLGAGVVDRLRQMNVNVVGVNFGSSSDRWVEGAPKAADKRAEMWASMRAWLKYGSAIPDDDRLAFELMAPCYTFTPDNAIRLEKKDDMKKRGIRSPDIADALALTFAYPVIGRALQRAEDDRLDEAYDPVWG